VLAVANDDQAAAMMRLVHECIEARAGSLMWHSESYPGRLALLLHGDAAIRDKAFLRCLSFPVVTLVINSHRQVMIHCVLLVRALWCAALGLFVCYLLIIRATIHNLTTYNICRRRVCVGLSHSAGWFNSGTFLRWLRSARLAAAPAHCRSRSQVQVRKKAGEKQLANSV
jgi:hypothetical protein